MTKVDMSRRCSHCGHNGHNSRTCPERGLKLFGVRISTDGFMRKSVSMGNLSAAAAQNPPCSTPEPSESAGDGGYVSDGLVQTSNSRERKKGVPWTEEEHKLFLVGLQKLGKGDWRGISRNFVTSRTPTQVASHAQKYFLRQSNLNKRKRRSSLFDIPADAQVEEPPRRIPELRLGSNNATAGAGSGSFAESTGSPVSVGVPVPVAAAFTVPEAPLGFPPCLSLGRSSTAEESAAAAAAAAYLNMAEQTYWKAPAPQISGSIPTQDLASSCSFTGAAKEETEDEESIEERGLSLSIAPPCVEDASSGRAQKQKHQQQQHSSFRTGQLGPKSSAISVV